jgi:hypothetical protein
MIGWGKRAVLMMLAISGLAALMLAGAYESFLVPRSGYVLIRNARKSVIYLKFQGDEFRAAASIKGLRSAAPIKLHAADSSMMSDEFMLPFPDDQFPRQILQGCFIRLAHYNDVKCGAAMLEPSGDFKRAEDWVLGNLSIFPTEDAKTDWTCWVPVRLPLGRSPGRAPAIELPTFKPLKLTIQTVPAGDKLGIGLRVHAGNVEVAAIQQGRFKNVTAQIRLVDEAGVEVASKTDGFPLLGFG